MDKRVYFSFNSENDLSMANEIKKCWATNPNRKVAGFYNDSLWKKVETEAGDLGLKRIIDKGLGDTSATVVLISRHTQSSRWVRYEIVKSFARGNKLMGIYINDGKDIGSNLINPFDDLACRISGDGHTISFYEWQKIKWVLYEDYSYEHCNYGSVYWHKFFKLSRLGFDMYNWTDDNGAENIGRWIGK